MIIEAMEKKGKSFNEVLRLINLWFTLSFLQLGFSSGFAGSLH